MGDWRVTTLGDVATFLNGYPFKPAELGSTGLPVVRIKQLLDPAAAVDRSEVTVREQNKIADGDLIFSWSGTLAARIWSRGPALLNQHLYKVVEQEGTSSRWLHLVLDNAVEALNLAAHGTTMKHVTKSDLERHVVRQPPLNVQHRIVDLVGSLDALGIALEAEAEAAGALYQQHLAAMLTRSASTTLLSACMTLETHRERVDADTEYMIAGVLRSGQGMIDRGVIRGSATTYGALYRLRPNQLIMRKLTAWEGPITVVPADFAGYVASPEFPTFNLDPDQLLPDFMRHVCRWPGLWTEMRQRITGSVQRRQRLSPEQLLSIALRLPLAAEQRAALPALDSLYEVSTRLEAEARALAALRNSLLPALLSGHLEVPESYDELVGAL